MIQYKSITAELKDLSVDKREVVAYFNTFDSVDSDNDVVRKGSFLKTLSENKDRIKHLFNHWDSVGKFMTLEEDNTGLIGRSKIGRHTLGNDVLYMYQDGIITEHSIGYNVIKSNNLNMSGQDVREITEIRLWEGSSLDKWGANEFTPVMAVSDKAVKQYSETITKLTKALRNGKYTDETMRDFEIQLHNLQKFLQSIQSEPVNTTHEPFEKDTQKGIDFNKLNKIFKN